MDATGTQCLEDLETITTGQHPVQQHGVEGFSVESIKTLFARSRLGTAWEKGERLAKLVAHRRTLLVLDGLEPVQNPLVHKKDAYGSLPSRRFCASLLPSIRAFA
jgi:hypothetical protein